MCVCAAPPRHYIIAEGARSVVRRQRDASTPASAQPLRAHTRLHRWIQEVSPPDRCPNWGASELVREELVGPAGGGDLVADLRLICLHSRRLLISGVSSASSPSLWEFLLLSIIVIRFEITRFRHHVIITISSTRIW